MLVSITELFSGGFVIVIALLAFEVLLINVTGLDKTETDKKKR